MLIGNYLRRMFPEVFKLRCNGMFSSCDRDGEQGWKRTLTSCIRCCAEQSEFSRWGGLSDRDLSGYIQPDEIVASRRWIVQMSQPELMVAEYQGQNLFELCRGSWQTRFGNVQPDPQNRSHDQVLRSLLIATLRARIACDRLLDQENPNLTLVANGTDFLSASYLVSARAKKSDAALFQWDLNKRSVRIVHPRSDNSVFCPLILEGLSSMRSDPATWSPDLIAILSELLTFLDISENQFKLPLAR